MGLDLHKGQVKMRWIAVIFVVFLPFFSARASAQDADRFTTLEAVERDGMTYTRVRARSRAPYEGLLDIANRGVTDDAERVTPDQIDAANQCSVIYVCRSGGSQTLHRNGVCGTSRAPVTFDTFCPEGQPYRWLVHGIIYEVPTARSLTGSEEVERVTTEARRVREAEAGSPEGTVTVDTLARWNSGLLRAVRSHVPATLLEIEEAHEAVQAVHTAGRVQGAALPRTPDGTDAGSPADDSPEEGDPLGESGDAKPSAEKPMETTDSPRWILPLMIVMIGLLLMALVLLAMRILGWRKQNKALRQSSQSHAEALRPVADAREHKEHHAPFEEWTRSVMRNRHPTVKLINEMAEVHWLLQDLERDSKTWSPAYGSIRDNNNLGRVLEEVAETRLIRAVIEKEFPGTPFVPEAYARLFQAQRSNTGSGGVYVEDTKKVAKLEAEVAEMSKALEAMRTGDAKRMKELEDELEKARQHRGNGHSADTPDRSAINEVMTSAQAHVGDVLSHFEPLIEATGKVHFKGKAHDANNLLADLYDNLSSLSIDIDRLSSLLAPRTLPYMMADAKKNAAPRRPRNGSGKHQPSPHPRTIGPPRPDGQDN